MPKRTPDPTPEEIAQRAKEIQSSWSEETRRERRLTTGFKKLRGTSAVQKVIRLKKFGFSSRGICRETGLEKKDVLAILRGDYYVCSDLTVEINRNAFKHVPRLYK